MSKLSDDTINLVSALLTLALSIEAAEFDPDPGDQERIHSRERLLNDFWTFRQRVENDNV